MKRILAILLFLVAFATSQAQTSTGVIVYMKTSITSTSLSDTGDIITNATDTSRFYLTASNFTNGSIQLCTYYISGTSPIVTAFLETSNNGLTWNRRQAGIQITGDTINLTPLSGITDSDGLAFTSNNVYYYRISVHGHKTQSVGLKATACLRKDKS